MRSIAAVKMPGSMSGASSGFGDPRVRDPPVHGLMRGSDLVGDLGERTYEMRYWKLRFQY